MKREKEGNWETGKYFADKNVASNQKNLIKIENCKKVYEKNFILHKTAFVSWTRVWRTINKAQTTTMDNEVASI